MLSVVLDDGVTQRLLGNVLNFAVDGEADVLAFDRSFDDLGGIGVALAVALNAHGTRDAGEILIELTFDASDTEAETIDIADDVSGDGTAGIAAHATGAHFEPVEIHAAEGGSFFIADMVVDHEEAVVAVGFGSGLERSLKTGGIHIQEARHDGGGNLFIRDAPGIDYENVRGRADGEQVAVAVVNGTALSEDLFKIFLLAVSLANVIVMRHNLEHE